MDAKSEESEPPIDPHEVIQDKASVSTTVSDISFLNRYIIYWASPFQILVIY